VSEISKWFRVKEDDPAEVDVKRESVGLKAAKIYVDKCVYL
jgi:hypothetical protein